MDFSVIIGLIGDLFVQVLFGSHLLAGIFLLGFTGFILAKHNASFPTYLAVYVPLILLMTLTSLKSGSAVGGSYSTAILPPGLAYFVLIILAGILALAYFKLFRS